MNKKLKATLIILASLLFFAVIIFLITRANQDKPFNKVTFTESNFVRNKTDMQYLDTLVLAGLHALEIDNNSILILPLNVQTSGEIELKAHIRQVENGYIIFIKDVDRNSNIEIIAHELIHLQQYRSGDLTVNLLTNELIFDKKTYQVDNLPAYDVRPWETEAFLKQEDLKIKIKNILY